jgi:hypothetical protein
MGEDGLDDGRVVHVGDDPAASATGTGDDILEVDSAEQGRPIDLESMSASRDPGGSGPPCAGATVLRWFLDRTLEANGAWRTTKEVVGAARLLAGRCAASSYDELPSIG